MGDLGDGAHGAIGHMGNRAVGHMGNFFFSIVLFSIFLNTVWILTKILLDIDIDVFS